MQQNNKEARKASRALITGRVQGVGFRFWTMQTAKAFGVTGWVRNCPDYSVEVFAEATPEVLYDFFSVLKHKHPRAYIASFSVIAAQYEGHKSFTVQY